MRLVAPLLVPTLLPAILGLAAALTATAARADSESDDHHRRRTLVVRGEGETRGQPDMAEINVGVVSEAESARQAVEANNEAMSSLFSTLEQLGIADKDMQTSSFQVSPRYRHDPKRREEPPRIVGYRVSNQVHIRIRDLKNIGQALDKVVQSGANQIHGIQFAIEDAEKLTDEARRKAIQDARRKARLLADEAGVGLGKVLEIHESSTPDPRPQHRLAIAEASSAVPIASGQHVINAQVQMTFELVDEPSGKSDEESPGPPDDKSDDKSDDK